MPAALALVTTGPSVTTLFGMPCPLFSPAVTAATPATIAPPWMRQEGLRTVAIHPALADRLDRRRHRVDAADQDVGAVVRLHDVVGGQRHVVIVEEGGIDLRIFGQIGFPQPRRLRYVPIGGLGIEHLDTRILLDDGVEALGAALRAGVAERALGHDDLALAADRVDECLRDRGAHEFIVGRQERMDVDLVERRDQRVHVDDRDAGIDHLLHRLGQRADAERLDGNEIPFLRSHIVDRRALLDGVELAVEPGDLDIEQLAPPFGRLLALGAPRRLQPGVGEGRLQRLLGTPHFRRKRWIYAQSTEQGGCRAGSRCHLKKIAPGSR